MYITGGPAHAQYPFLSVPGRSTISYRTVGGTNFCAVLDGDAKIDEGKAINPETDPTVAHVIAASRAGLRRRQAPDI